MLLGNQETLDFEQSHLQKRSNSIPITASAIQERLSLLRNTLSPVALASTKGSNSIPNLQLSPLLTSKSSGSLSEFYDTSSERSSPHRPVGIQRLWRSLSISSMSDSSSVFEPKEQTAGFDMKTDDVIEKTISIESIESKLRDQKNIIPSEFVDPGIDLLRITHRKKVKRCFNVDTENNLLRWNNKSSSFLRIDKIKNIRVGDDAKNYREEFKISSEYKDLWITVIYFNDSISNNIKALHVLATRKYEYDIFVNTLRLLVFVNRDLLKNISLGLDSELFTNFHWNNYVMNENRFNERIVDTPQTTISQTLDAEGVLKLTKRLSINIDKDYLLRLFHKCDVDHNGYLDFEEFKTFVSMLRTRLEISDLFTSITSLDRMSFDQFQDFLINTQKEDYDISFIWKLFNKFSTRGHYLSLEEFQNFLKSSYTSPNIQIEEDFTRPLNEYYISSSHNTYLLGRQFAGESSVEGYIRALQRGCRCIEIDLWDGQLENGEKGPVVKHGRSFTTSVRLRDVLQAIKKYAFIFTPFPLIISLEVHCTSENQAIIKNLLCDILGEMLVLKPLMANSLTLPSPKELRHKILIKVKKSDSFSGSLSNSFSSSTSTSTSTTTSASSISEDNLSKSAPKESFITRAKGLTKINPELASLGVYVSALKFRNFSLPESKTVNHCFSFSEKTVNKMVKDPIKLYSLDKHNRKFFMRVYPSKYRYNSTNFNPIQFWELGIQMVATNWQMYDLGQQLNESMFLVGSQSGYVLKPVELRQLSKGQDVEPKTCKVRLSIDIISAQQLPIPKDYNGAMNPFIEFEIYGYDSIKFVNETSRTNIVRANGFNPIWQESFEREITTSYPSLVFVRLLVKCLTDSDSNLLVGVCALKLTSLKKGYRHLTVYDLQGEEFIFSKLFVKIDYDEVAI